MARADVVLMWAGAVAKGTYNKREVVSTWTRSDSYLAPPIRRHGTQLESTHINGGTGTYRFVRVGQVWWWGHRDVGS